MSGLQGSSFVAFQLAVEIIWSRTMAVRLTSEGDAVLISEEFGRCRFVLRSAPFDTIMPSPMQTANATN